ncbi:hypothetical protein LX77_01412 [Gelidibacter algens]|uniref:DUF4386 family protein n=2 Tax=Gelidibacter algens TaxID=49280 RepID=A0A1A7QHY6_9FLAO|nr:hypothetical protein [Gelidibacter algens]OBX19021.1 hypothetical protein A9996_18915 [Gelidibacter algens]RAJ25111.1 hypothetical protein LX77_01412 [Gelidibacter algens]
MDTNFYKSAGFSLIIGSFMASAIMMLHPAGGDINHIIQISALLRITHSLAIFSLPFILFGFYGLTHKLSNTWRLSSLAFIIITFGLFTVMLAGLLNGLALPYFLGKYSENVEHDISIVKTIVNYNFAVSKALDYVFIVSFCSAITIYSLITIVSKQIPKWIGYFGITILILVIIGAITNFEFTDIDGFRIVVFNIAGWILFSGVSLIRSNNNLNEQRKN